VEVEFVVETISFGSDVRVLRPWVDMHLLPSVEVVNA
jgi:hypothetical protein